VSRRGRWAALRHGELPAPKARWRSPPTPEIRPATQERGSEGQSGWLARTIKLSVRSRPLGHRDGLPDPEPERRSAGAQPEAITSSLITLRFPTAVAGPGGVVHRRSADPGRPGTGEWALWSRGQVHEGPGVKCNMG
jgi:hypothetical protein